MKTPEEVLKQLLNDEIGIYFGQFVTYSVRRFEGLCTLLKSGYTHKTLRGQREAESILKGVGEAHFEAVRAAVENFRYALKWKQTSERVERLLTEFFDARRMAHYTGSDEIIAALWDKARTIRRTKEIVRNVVREETGEYKLAYSGLDTRIRNARHDRQHILIEYDEQTGDGKSVCGLDRYFTPCAAKPPICIACWERVSPVPENPLDSLPAVPPEAFEVPE